MEIRFRKVLFLFICSLGLVGLTGVARAEADFNTTDDQTSQSVEQPALLEPAGISDVEAVEADAAVHDTGSDQGTAPAEPAVLEEPAGPVMAASETLPSKSKNEPSTSLADDTQPVSAPATTTSTRPAAVVQPGTTDDVQVASGPVGKSLQKPKRSVPVSNFANPEPNIPAARPKPIPVEDGKAKDPVIPISQASLASFNVHSAGVFAVGTLARLDALVSDRLTAAMLGLLAVLVSWAASYVVWLRRSGFVGGARAALAVRLNHLGVMATGLRHRNGDVARFDYGVKFWPVTA